jgi:hypothetical protein
VKLKTISGAGYSLPVKPYLMEKTSHHALRRKAGLWIKTKNLSGTEERHLHETKAFVFESHRRRRFSSHEMSKLVSTEV